jgi:hypothetical protein
VANSGWTADPVNFTLPPGSVPPDTYLYIGDSSGDTVLQALLADSGIVFHFGNGHAYVIALNDLGGGFVDTGAFEIVGYDAGTGNFYNLLETLWQPPSAGHAFDTIDFGNIQQAFGMSYLSMRMLAENDARLAANNANTGGILSLGDFTAHSTRDYYTDIDGNLTIRSNEIGWGLWNYISSTSNSAAIGTGLTTVLAFPSTTYKAGRAYRVTVHSGTSGNTAGGYAYMALNKSNAGGAQLQEFYRYPNPAASTVYASHGVADFVVGAADVTAVIAVTMLASVGTVTQFGSATSPRWASIEDIGLANQYSNMLNLPVLV